MCVEVEGGGKNKGITLTIPMTGRNELFALWPQASVSDKVPSAPKVWKRSEPPVSASEIKPQIEAPTAMQNELPPDAVQGARTLSFFYMALGFANFLLAAVLFVLNLTYKNAGINIHVYCTVSMRVATIEALVQTVRLPCGIFAAGTAILMMPFVSSLGFILNGVSCLAYAMTAEEAILIQKGIRTTTSVSKNSSVRLPPFFNYLYYQTAGSSIFYQSIVPFGIVLSMGITVCCAIFGLDDIESLMGVALCTILGMTTLALVQGSAQATVVSMLVGDATHLIMSVLASFVVVLPWGMAMALVISLATTSGTKAVPWFFWIMMIVGLLVCLSLVVRACYSIAYKVDWKKQEIITAICVTTLNLVFGICFFAGIVTRPLSDQAIGLDEWIEDA